MGDLSQIFFRLCMFLAGFIDSIVGGGGLITLPLFTFFVGPGAPAVATNKVVATVSALTALIIYARKGHLRIKIAGAFFISVGIGTILGSRLALYLPVELFKYFIIAVCPVFLFIILNKKYFLAEENKSKLSKSSLVKLAVSGIFCGVYDGLLGPGGGTLMLLSLVVIAKLPLMVAIASSKFANVISATTALVSFSISGVVNWRVGLDLAVYIFLGALLGATLANKKAEKVARPLLVLVVIGLILKLSLE